MLVIEQKRTAPVWTVWSQGGTYRVSVGDFDFQESNTPSNGSFLGHWSASLDGHVTITVFGAGIGPNKDSVIGASSYVLSLDCGKPYIFHEYSWTDAVGLVGEGMSGGVQLQVDLLPRVSVDGSLELPRGNFSARGLLGIPANSLGEAQYKQDNRSWNWNLMNSEHHVFRADGSVTTRHRISIDYVGLNEYWMLFLVGARLIS